MVRAPVSNQWTMRSTVTGGVESGACRPMPRDAIPWLGVPAWRFGEGPPARRGGCAVGLA